MSLEEKAINIKGKQYVLVSDRIIYFNENYPNGSIKTELISDPKSEHIIVKATITPDSSNPMRMFTGYSQAKIGDGYINKTSALENAETSSVGRGLAMMGIGVLDSVASVDEINKAETMAKQKPVVKPQTVKQVVENAFVDKKDIIRKQIAEYIRSNKYTKEYIKDTMIGLYNKDKYDDLSEEEAISFALILEEKKGV